MTSGSPVDHEKADIFAAFVLGWPRSINRLVAVREMQRLMMERHRENGPCLMRHCDCREKEAAEFFQKKSHRCPSFHSISCSPVCRSNAMGHQIVVGKIVWSGNGK